MRKHLILTTLAALAASAPAAADVLGNSFIEAGYVSNEIDFFGVDGSGFALNGSFEFNQRVFGFASIVDADYDQGSQISTTAVAVGVGFAWPLSSTLNLESSVSYENLDFKRVGFGSGSEEGIGLSVGLASAVGESLELSAGLKYTDFGHDLNDFTFSAGARYYFTPTFAAGIDVSDNDDGTAWSILLRYDFGYGR